MPRFSLQPDKGLDEPPFYERPPTDWRQAAARLGRAARRWLFSLRGAMVLVVLVAGAAIATGGYLSWRGRLRERIVQEYQQAETCYQQADFTAARDAFARTLDLIRTLRDHQHELLLEITRKHAESRVIADLLTVSLEELARRAATAPTPEAWSRAFDREFRGRTVILDTVLTQRPGPAGRPPTIGYDLSVPQGHSVGLDLTGCPLFQSAVWRDGTRVLFAVTLDSMSFAPPAAGQPGRWNLRFAPDGYLLIRDASLLRATGLDLDDDTAAAIARQRTLDGP
jgi:hypothetical protein